MLIQIQIKYSDMII